MKIQFTSLVADVASRKPTDAVALAKTALKTTSGFNSSWSTNIMGGKADTVRKKLREVIGTFPELYR